MDYSRKIDFWWGALPTKSQFFQVGGGGGGAIKFLAGGRGLSPFPPVGRTNRKEGLRIY